MKSLTEQTAEIAFDDAPRTISPALSDLRPAKATATSSELEMPLANLIRDTAHLWSKRSGWNKGRCTWKVWRLDGSAGRDYAACGTA